MELERTFSVDAPIGAVWDTLMDFERVAGCIPGAQILGRPSADTYQVGLKVKLGAITMQYKGTLNVIERDAASHRAVMAGQAQEIRGQGTAQAKLTLRLAESEGATAGTVSADLALSGKAAAMGQSIIGGVTDQMMALFAKNLQALLAAPQQPSPPVPAEPPEPSEQESSRTGTREAPPVPAASDDPGRSQAGASGAGSAPPTSAPSSGSLDAIALIRGMVAEKVLSPAGVLGLLAVVAAAYVLGRCAGRKARR